MSDSDGWIVLMDLLLELSRDAKKDSDMFVLLKSQ